MKKKIILIVVLLLTVTSLVACLMIFNRKKNENTTVVKDDVPVSNTDTSETPVTNADGKPSTFVPDKREEINDDDIFFAYTKGEDVKQDNTGDNSHITDEPEKDNNVDEKSGIILDPNELEILNY